MVEYVTVSTGIQAADIILKTANVEIIEAQTVCPGKYIVLFSGELSAVKASMEAAKEKFSMHLIRWHFSSYLWVHSHGRCEGSWSTGNL